MEINDICMDLVHLKIRKSKFSSLQELVIRLVRVSLLAGRFNFLSYLSYADKLRALFDQYSSEG